MVLKCCFIKIISNRPMESRLQFEYLECYLHIREVVWYVFLISAECTVCSSMNVPCSDQLDIPALFYETFQSVGKRPREQKPTPIEFQQCRLKLLLSDCPLNKPWQPTLLCNSNSTNKLLWEANAVQIQAMGTLLSNHWLQVIRYVASRPKRYHKRESDVAGVGIV